MCSCRQKDRQAEQRFALPYEICEFVKRDNQLELYVDEAHLQRGFSDIKMSNSQKYSILIFEDKIRIEETHKINRTGRYR